MRPLSVPGLATTTFARSPTTSAPGLPKRASRLSRAGSSARWRPRRRARATPAGSLSACCPGPIARANEHAGVTLVTGIGHARNLAVVASADVVVAVGGEWGTLSEIALAGVLSRPVVVVNGWKLDHAGGLPSEVHYADDAASAVAAAVRLADG